MTELHVTIPNVPALEKKTQKGTPYWAQTGYLHTLDDNGAPLPYPERFTLEHWEKDRVWPAGEYVLDGTNFQINKYKRLEATRRLLLRTFKKAS